MMQRPQFKAHFHVEVVKGEGVFLVSEIGHSVLNGRLFETVAPLIDGRRTVDEIIDALQGQASAAEVFYAITLLEKKEYLSESDHSLPAGESAFWAIQGIPSEMAARHLAEAPVSVTAFGDVTVAPFLSLLESLHVRVGEAAGMGVVLTDDYLRKELQAYNQEALRSGRPWMLCKPVGGQILIGPVFYPGQTGCWNCLAQRLRINRTVEIFVQRKQGRDEPFSIPNAGTTATQQIAYSMAANEVAKWIARGEAPSSEGRILSLDVLSWQTQFHPLTRQPDCVACGASPPVLERPAKPVVLESRKKTFTEDGGHRVMTPEETLKKYERHVSPITGAVKNLERHVRANDGVMHVYLAGENFAAQHYTLKNLQSILRGRSAGKGMTDLQAKASGLCEALERYSGVFQGTETRRKARLSELNGLGIHPNDCMRFSERQYQQRETSNPQVSRYHYVPLPFDEEAEIGWIPAWSLTHRVHRYLPAQFCYFAYPSSEKVYCVSCSNGNAAGNTLEEAILQGFLELVERDSVAMWWYNRLSKPAVDLDSFDEPYLRRVKTFLRERGRELWVLDLTADLNIPVFAAVSRRTEQQPEQIMIGFGAHLDARIAVLRAVTEMNQMLVWLLCDDREAEKIFESGQDSDTLNWLKTATIVNQPYLVPDQSKPPRAASAYPKHWSDDLRDDVRFCQELVERHGMEMLVLDQTRPDIELPVVKVIVPGLRHFWARFAPGRLYEIPVTQGWLPQPLKEEQLNPVPMFL